MKSTSSDDVYVDDEEVLTKIIKAIYKKAEKERLDTCRLWLNLWVIFNTYFTRIQGKRTRGAMYAKEV